MASAGHAQAHSSQPMHFSSPSGHRLSWWWPWYRGAVGRLSSWYITVSTFRNISRKVTPNPLTGLRKSSTGDLLSRVAVGRALQRHVAKLETVVVRQVERGHREALHHAALLLVRGRGRVGREFRRAPLSRGIPERDQRQDENQDQAAHRVHRRRGAVIAPGPDRRDEQDPDDGQRDEDLPAQRHQLVVAGPRQRAAQPDVAEQQDEKLDQEPQHRPPAAVRPGPERDGPRGAPAAEEQGDRHRGDRRHVDVLGQEEHRELHRRVLGHVAGYDLALALGEVERDPVRFADHRDQVDHEGHGKQPRVPVVLLRRDDLVGVQRSRVEEDRHERQRHRDLVADDLGGGTQRAEHRVRSAGRPAGQHDAVDTDRAHREYQQHGDRDVGHLQRRPVVEDRYDRAPRDDREADERRRGRDDRRDEEHQLVHPGRDDVLLERQLERVGDRLQEPPRPGPVGPRPVLHAADHAALEPDHEDGGEQQEHEHDPDLQQHHPPDDLVEVAQRRVRRERVGHYSALLRVTLLPWPAPRPARIG